MLVQTDWYCTLLGHVATFGYTIVAEEIHLSDTGPGAEHHYEHDKYKYADYESRNELHRLIISSSHDTNYNLR